MSLLGDPANWDAVKSQFPIGVQVTGVVGSVAPFGVFVRLGQDGIGLLRVPDMAGDDRKQMTDYPQVGQTLTATVIWHDDRNRQVTLSQRA
jgi:ribosomal protein S1